MNDRKYFGGRENVDICRASGAPLLISYSIGVYCLSCFQAPLWALLFFPSFFPLLLLLSFSSLYAHHESELGKPTYFTLFGSIVLFAAKGGLL